MPDPKPTAFNQIQNLFKRLSNSSFNRSKASNLDTRLNTQTQSPQTLPENQVSQMKEIMPTAKPIPINDNSVASQPSIAHNYNDYRVNFLSEAYSKYLIEHLHFNINSTKYGTVQFGKGFTQVKRELQILRLENLLNFFRPELRENLQQRIKQDPQLQTGMVRAEILGYLNKNFKQHVSYLFTLHSTEKEYPNSWASIVYHDDLERYARNNNLFLSRLLVQQSYGHIITQKVDEIRKEAQKFFELLKGDIKQAEIYKQNLFWNWTSFGLSSVYYQNGISENNKFDAKSILVHLGGGDHLVFDSKWAKVIEDGIYLKLRLEFNQIVDSLITQSKKQSQKTEPKKVEGQDSLNQPSEPKKPVKIVGNLETSIAAGVGGVIVEAIKENPVFENIPVQIPEISRISNTDKVIDSRPKQEVNRSQPNTQEISNTTPIERVVPNIQVPKAQTTQTQVTQLPKPNVVLTTDINKRPDIVSFSRPEIKPQASQTKVDFSKPIVSQTNLNQTSRAVTGVTGLLGASAIPLVTQGISTKAVTGLVGASTIPVTAPLVRPIERVVPNIQVPKAQTTQTQVTQLPKPNVVLTTDINKRPDIVSFSTGTVAGIGALVKAGSLINTNLTQSQVQNNTSFIQIPKTPEIKQFSQTELSSDFNQVNNQFEKIGLTVSSPELGMQVSNFVEAQKTLYPNKPIEASVITKEFLKTNQIQVDDVRAPQIQNLVTAFTTSNQINSLPVNVTFQNPQANALISGGLITLQTEQTTGNNQPFQTFVIPPSQVSTLNIQVPNTNQTQTIVLQNTRSQPMRFVFQSNQPQQTQTKIISAQIFRPVISQTPEKIGITSYFQTEQGTNAFNPNTKFQNTATLTPVTINTTNLFSSLNTNTIQTPKTTILNSYQGVGKTLQTNLGESVAPTLGKINLPNKIQNIGQNISQTNDYSQFKEYGNAGYSQFTPTTKNARTPKKALILNQAQADRYLEENPINRVLKYQEDTKNGEPVFIVLANNDDYLLEYGSPRSIENEPVLSIEDLDQAEADTTINKLYEISNSKMEESELSSMLPAFAEEYFPQNNLDINRTNIGQNKSEIQSFKQDNFAVPDRISPIVLPNLTTGLNIPTTQNQATNTFKPTFNSANLKTETPQPKAENSTNSLSQKTPEQAETSKTEETENKEKTENKEGEIEKKDETQAEKEIETKTNKEQEPQNNIKNFNRKDGESENQAPNSKEGQKTASLDGENKNAPDGLNNGNVATLERPQTEEQTQTANQTETDKETSQSTDQDSLQTQTNREALERSFQNSGGENNINNQEISAETERNQIPSNNSSNSDEREEFDDSKPADRYDKNGLLQVNKLDENNDYVNDTNTNGKPTEQEKSDKLASDKLEKATGKRVPFGKLREQAKGKIDDTKNQIKQAGTKAYDATLGKGVNAVKQGAGKIANKTTTAIANSPVGKSIGNVANRVSALAGKAKTGTIAAKNKVGQIGKGLQMARDAKGAAKDFAKDLAKNAIMGALRSAIVTFGPWIAGALIFFTVFFVGPAVGAGLTIQQAYCEKANNQVANLARNMAEGLVFNDKKLEASAAILLGQKLAIESDFGKRVAQACGFCASGTGPSGTNDKGSFVAGSYRDFEGNITKAFLALGYTDPNQLAYILATVSHESGDGKYCEEIDGRNQALANGYSGGENFFGRGYVQLTHDYNYRKFSKVLGVDLVANPSALCDPQNAARVAVIGSMQQEFSFTGVTLPQFVGGGKKDFYNARTVINGLDAASSIAAIAENYVNKAPQLIAQYKNGGGGASTSSSPTKTSMLNFTGPLDIVAQAIFGQIDVRASRANPEDSTTGGQALGNNTIPPDKIKQLNDLISANKITHDAGAQTIVRQAQGGLLNASTVDFIIALGSKYAPVTFSSLNDAGHGGTGHGNGLAMDITVLTLNSKEYAPDDYTKGSTDQASGIKQLAEEIAGMGVKVIYLFNTQAQLDSAGIKNPKVQPWPGHNNHWHVELEVDGKITKTDVGGPPGSNTGSGSCQCGGSGSNNPTSSESTTKPADTTKPDPAKPTPVSNLDLINKYELFAMNLFGGIDTLAASKIRVKDKNGSEQNALVPTPQEVPDLATRLLVIGTSAREAGTDGKGNQASDGIHLGWFQQDKTESAIFQKAGTDPNSLLGDDQKQLKTFLARIENEGFKKDLEALSKQIKDGKPTPAQLQEIAKLGERIQRSGESAETVATVAQYIQSAIDQKLVDAVTSGATDSPNAGSSSSCLSNSDCSPPATPSTSSSNSSASSSSKSVYNIFNKIKVYAADSSSTSNSQSSSNSSGTTPTSNCNTSKSNGNPQLLEIAKAYGSVGSPQGRCWAKVADYVAELVTKGGKVGNGKFDGQTNFPDVGYGETCAVNVGVFFRNQKNLDDYGLRNLALENPNMSPFDAPPGGIVVVSAGYGQGSSPCGDITVADGNGKFYNDGTMTYIGREHWNGPQAKSGDASLPPEKAGSGKLVAVLVSK